jgi:hypothetical protein
MKRTEKFHVSANAPECQAQVNVHAFVRLLGLELLVGQGFRCGSITKTMHSAVIDLLNFSGTS